MPIRAEAHRTPPVELVHGGIDVAPVIPRPGAATYQGRRRRGGDASCPYEPGARAIFSTAAQTVRKFSPQIFRIAGSP